MRKFNLESNIRVFNNVKAMVFAAIMVALSVSGKVFSLNISSTLRIGYEHLPIILSGITMGPFVGCIVGISADLLGCLAKGDAPFPLITVAMAFMGFTAGIVQYFFKEKLSIVSIVATEISAHVIGSIIIKTIALIILMNVQKDGILMLFVTRSMQTILICTLEIAIIILLCENSYIKKELKGLLN